MNELKKRSDFSVNLRTMNFSEVLSQDGYFLAQAQKNPRRFGGEKRIEERYQRSRAVYLQRLKNKPAVTYPKSLPVAEKVAAIKTALTRHQVVIVCGETGSGKTTQLPKICLDLGRGVRGMIGHTQPRRLAAKAVAGRIAEELKVPLGKAVGYQVRFDDKTGKETYIKVMTDGILLAEIGRDRYLRAYDTLIIDEAHERSLTIDFLLGYLKEISRKRPDLKIIITSATLNAEVFRRHFADSAVVNVAGRTYPVEIRYRPPLSLDDDQEDVALPEAVLRGVRELWERGAGDILVFLPGEREIKETLEELRGNLSPHDEILPLYSALPSALQQKIFAAHRGRRVILATNIAETSLTVPGIKYVIDSGLARVKRFSPRLKVEQLRVEKIARSAAKQRAGRAGRQSAGICLRLYEEADFETRAEFTDPEILRSNLAHVILLMKSLKLGDIATFPFIDQPESKLIKAGIQTLRELGALNDAEELTADGRKMAKIPLDPRFAKMLLKAYEYKCSGPVLVIVAALSIQDPRERSGKSKQKGPDEAQKIFSDPESDFFTYLNLWQFLYTAEGRSKTGNKELLRQSLRYHLSYPRLREWQDLYRQVKVGLIELHFWAEQKSPQSTGEDEKEKELQRILIHRALLSGLITNIGRKSEERQDFIGVRGNHFAIFPTSALAKKPPTWVMAGELMATRKLYAREVAKIDPAWIEIEAAALLKQQYFEPHWSAKRGEVVAAEKVTLFGLTIVPKRWVSFGAIDPVLARELFIREGLAAGRLELKSPFYQKNKEIIAKITEWENQERRQDIVIEEVLFDFYAERLPPACVSLATFKAWIKADPGARNELLTLDLNEIIKNKKERETAQLFPRTLRLENVSLPLTYRFEPGHPWDGVTVTLPLSLLPKLNAVRLEWLTPGMIREKIQLLIKALPKEIRKQCTPTVKFVTQFLSLPPDLNRPLLPQLALFIGEWTEGRVNINQEQINECQAVPLPPHCYVNIRVVDEEGKELAFNRDFAALKELLAPKAARTFHDYGANYERSDVKAWDFGDITAPVQFYRGGKLLSGYLALTAIKGPPARVDLLVYPTRQAAIRAHEAGVVALSQLFFKDQIKDFTRDLTREAPLLLPFYPQISSAELKEDVVRAVSRESFLGDDAPLPFTEQDFAESLARARRRFPQVKMAAKENLAAIAREYAAIKKELDRHPLAPVLNPWLNRLIYSGFYTQTPWRQLARLPLYLKAAGIRMSKYLGQGAKDRQYEEEIAALEKRWRDYQEKTEKLGHELTADFAAYRWLIEELRISFFAQELKTMSPVSVKRLDKIWQELLKIKE